MAAILIIAHAPLASALREAALHVFPELGSVLTGIDVQAQASAEDVQQDAGARLAALLQAQRTPSDPGAVLILSDLFGATPCNIAQRLAADPRTRLLTGVNMPMLLRALTYRHETLETLAARALAGATQGVMQIGGTAPQTQPSHRYLQDDQAYRQHQQ